MPVVYENILDWPYSWGAGDGDTLNCDLVQYSNPPKEVGLWTLFLKITTASGTNVITPTIQYLIDNSAAYGNKYALRNPSNATTFTATTSGVAFECRIDAMAVWMFNEGFRIVLDRATTAAVTVNVARILAI